MKQKFLNVQNPEQDMLEIDEPPSLSSLEIGQTVLKLHVSPYSKKTFVIGPAQESFRQKFFPLATTEDWNSWHWQLKNSITSYSQLEQILSLTSDERVALGYTNDTEILPLRITPYYASLLNPADSLQALRRSVVPLPSEFDLKNGEAFDPLSEHSHQPVPNIVHRYPDRVLFLATGFCSTYCRYCTRTHMVAKDKCHVGVKAWHEALAYIKEHTEIRDVLVSGGDPLTMPDSQIEYLLNELRNIEHVQIIRIGTKVPVVLPQRITKNLTAILKKYHPLFMSIHFTHPSEITPEVTEACARLSNIGIPLGSQTVLLKGINDNADTIKELMHGLLKIRVRPYYLYQCDPIPGSAHFRTSVQKGLDIIFALRGNTSGYAIPHYVIDAPGGGGKIPLLPQYLVRKENDKVVLRNYENKEYYYPDTEI